MQAKPWHRVVDTRALADLPFQPRLETYLTASSAGQILRALGMGLQLPERTPRAHVDVLVDVPTLGTTDYIYYTSDALLCGLEKLGPVVEKDPVDGVRGVVALWQYCHQEWRIEVFYTGAGRVGLAHLFPIDTPAPVAVPSVCGVFNPRSAEESPETAPRSPGRTAVPAPMAPSVRLGESLRAAQLAIQYLTIARSEAVAAGDAAPAGAAAPPLSNAERDELTRLRVENEVLKTEKAALQAQVAQQAAAATASRPQSRSVSPRLPAAQRSASLNTALTPPHALTPEETRHFAALQREADCVEEIRAAAAAARGGVAVHADGGGSAAGDVEELKRTLAETRRELATARAKSTDVERSLRQELESALRELHRSVQRERDERSGEAAKVDDLRAELQAARAEITRMQQRVVTLSSPARAEPQPNPPPQLGRATSASPVSHASGVSGSARGSVAPRRTPPQKRSATPSPVMVPPPPPADIPAPVPATHLVLATQQPRSSPPAPFVPAPAVHAVDVPSRHTSPPSRHTTPPPSAVVHALPPAPVYAPPMAPVVPGYPLAIPTDMSSGFGRPPSRSPSYANSERAGSRSPEV
eukprot:TRINITY_DN32986_c0_g1_i1.p1 TRINITY_DN32986_c0_g1~~TRINITY_DN32986_c0_g1_i1.p1  ORF type:complete len:586 (+),score=161.35 TRINITY_DN32986_c0_g1_i1:63-1820(+)